MFIKNLHSSKKHNDKKLVRGINFMKNLFGLLLVLSLSACALNMNGNDVNLNANSTPTSTATAADQVATPVVTPEGGTYSSDTLVTIDCETTGADIYYTIDGSEPTVASTLYSEPIAVSDDGTEMDIKAIAVKEGMSNSSVIANTYIIAYATLSALTISPSNSIIMSGSEITITSSVDGADIYYTTDGSTPDGTSSLYDSGSKPIVSASSTFKAVALKSQYKSSDVASASYVTFKMVSVPTPMTFPTSTNDLGAAATVSTAYKIAETETTYEVWEAIRTWAVDPARGYVIASVGIMGSLPPAGNNQHAVSTESWDSAVVWLNALTEYYNTKHGTSYEQVYTCGGDGPVLKDTTAAEACGMANITQKAGAKGFRLPINNEWELAARYINDANHNGVLNAGEYYPGNYTSGADAVYTATSGGVDIDGNGIIRYTSDVSLSHTGINPATSDGPVKSKAPNALGLYDISGNMWEWCFNILGPERSMRGGQWASFFTGVQIGYAGASNPQTYESASIGFRFVKTE